MSPEERRQEAGRIQADLAPLLARARTAELDALAYLIEMARLEAEDKARHTPRGYA